MRNRGAYAMADAQPFKSLIFQSVSTQEESMFRPQTLLVQAKPVSIETLGLVSALMLPGPSSYAFSYRHDVSMKAERFLSQTSLRVVILVRVDTERNRVVKPSSHKTVYERNQASSTGLRSFNSVYQISSSLADSSMWASCLCRGYCTGSHQG